MDKRETDSAGRNTIVREARLAKSGATITMTAYPHKNNHGRIHAWWVRVEHRDVYGHRTYEQATDDMLDGALDTVQARIAKANGQALLEAGYTIGYDGVLRNELGRVAAQDACRRQGHGWDYRQQQAYRAYVDEVARNYREQQAAFEADTSPDAMAAKAERAAERRAGGPGRDHR